MKKWSENEAIRTVTNAGAKNTSDKLFIVEGGLSGLRACSAMDFLTKHFGYNFVIKGVN